MRTGYSNSLIFRYLLFTLLVFTALFLSGCATITSNISPDVTIEDYKIFYVVPNNEDTRGVGEAIYHNLKKRGYKVEFGPSERMPEYTEIKVSYEAKWWWDITFYLLDLIIYFKDPESEVLIASGQSHRPSLERKSVDKMVDEILDKLYGISDQEN